MELQKAEAQPSATSWGWGATHGSHRGWTGAQPFARCHGRAMSRTLMRVASEGRQSFAMTGLGTFVLVSPVLCLSSSRVLFCFEAF